MLLGKIDNDINVTSDLRKHYVVLRYWTFICVFILIRWELVSGGDYEYDTYSSMITWRPSPWKSGFPTVEVSLRDFDVLTGIAPCQAVKGKYSQSLSQFLVHYPRPEDGQWLFCLLAKIQWVQVTIFHGDAKFGYKHQKSVC